MVGKIGDYPKGKDKSYNSFIIIALVRKNVVGQMGDYPKEQDKS